MRLIIRKDGSGSELDLFDVEPVISVHDLPCPGAELPVSGYLDGSIYRRLRVGGKLYTLAEWQGIAYAAWLDRRHRRGMYADIIPDVGESWTAKQGGTPITWPDWMVASWESDVRQINEMTLRQFKAKLQGSVTSS